MFGWWTTVWTSPFQAWIDDAPEALAAAARVGGLAERNGGGRGHDDG